MNTYISLVIGSK